MIKKIVPLLLLLILVASRGWAQPRNTCPAPFTRLVDDSPGSGPGGVAVATHYFCKNAAGDAMPAAAFLLPKGQLIAYQSTPSTTISLAAPTINTGLLGLSAASTIQTVTLRFTAAGVVALGVIPTLTIQDESNSAATGNKVIKNPGGTTLATIVTNGGAWSGYCTNTACFTTSLR